MSWSTDDAMEEDNLLLPAAGTDHSAGANSEDDASSSSGKRTRDGLEAVELEEEPQSNGSLLFYPSSLK
jgi:hypothetical protein